jgi:hypothetical protein
MRRAGLLILASLFVGPVRAQQPASAQQPVMVECRDLNTSANYLGPNETLINGKACRLAGTPLQVVESNPKPPPATVPTVTPTPSEPALPIPEKVAASTKSDGSSTQREYAKCRAGADEVRLLDWSANYVETIVATLKCNDEVAVLGILNGYGRARTSDGKEGYILLSDLSDSPSPTPVSSSFPPHPVVPATPNAQTVISFAVADSGGVHPGAPSWTQNWIRKNAKKYPEISFQQGPPVQGAQNYLIVLSSSANALSGFDPVVRTNTSTNTTPVSGSGTVTDNYGSTWSYSYDGQVTTTTTTTTHEDVPYTIESDTLYATAYDQNGTMVSQRWHVYSTKQGGDAANSLGYNLGNALFAINAKGHLVNTVVKDIEGKKKR